MYRYSKRLRIAASVVLIASAAVLFNQGRPHDILSRAALSALYFDTRRWFAGMTVSAYDSDPAITFWGDSLTAGHGATFGHDYPRLIAFLYRRHALNFGLSGETSRQLRERFLARAKPRGPETVVIWTGRNNTGEPERIESDIRDMINSLDPGSRFLVLGVINSADPSEMRGAGAYQRIMNLNADLRAAYGPRFVPIHEILVASANDRFPDDRENARGDVTPRSLRSDYLHLNDIGQAIVATAVENALVANGW